VNTTTNRPDGQSLRLHDDTQIYLCAGPSVRLFEVDVLEQVRSILNIRKSGFEIARAVLVRQGGENIAIELSQHKFAEAIWPDKEPGARIKQFKRGLKNLREDMDVTGFLIVDPQKQKPKLTEDGFKGQATLYAPGMYWQLSNALQERAKKIDFFAMPLDQRRRRVRVELKALLKEMGCVRRVSEKKVEDIRPPNPSLPCRCACASCASCAAKAPAVEPERAAEVRVDKSAVEKKLDAALEIIFDAGQDWINLNFKVNDFTRKVWAHCEQNELRMLEAVKRHNAPRVKLNGGQPK
jgi:hypothetical protein